MRIHRLCLGCILTCALAAPGYPGQTETLHVEVSLVTVGVRVTDKLGREVPGLREEDFRVLEDGLEQPISFFSNEEQPVSFCLLMDRSESMGRGDKLFRAQRAAQLLLKSVAPTSEFLFIPFNHQVSEPSGFSTDLGRIGEAIASTSAEGGTSLYDAILAGLEDMAAATHRKQVMVVITDGADQHSRSTLDPVIQRLLRSQVQMYLIGYFTPEEDEVFRLAESTVTLYGGKIVDNPRVTFARLAAESGAEAFFPTSQDALQQVIQQINTYLRTQYTIAYYPPNPTQRGTYRQIRVEVREKGLLVRARRGYVLGRIYEAGSSHPGEALASTPADDEADSESGEGRSPTPASPTRCEDFSDPSSGWPAREDAWYEDGTYRLQGTNVLVTNRPYVTDFQASLRIEVPSSAASAFRDSIRLPVKNRMVGAGLAFRVSEGGFYGVIVYFPPAASRAFCRVLRQEAGKNKDLARWPTQVLPGRPVSLRVLVRGHRIEVMVGGRLLGKVEDDRLNEGVIGLLLAGAGEARFDDFCLETALPPE